MVAQPIAYQCCVLNAAMMGRSGWQLIWRYCWDVGEARGVPQLISCTSITPCYGLHSWRHRTSVVPASAISGAACMQALRGLYSASNIFFMEWLGMLLRCAVIHTHSEPSCEMHHIHALRIIRIHREHHLTGREGGREGSILQPGSLCTASCTLRRQGH